MFSVDLGVDYTGEVFVVVVVVVNAFNSIITVCIILQLYVVI